MMATLCSLSKCTINHNYRLGQLGLYQAVKFQKKSSPDYIPEGATHIWFASRNPRPCSIVLERHAHADEITRICARVAWIEITSFFSFYYSSLTSFTSLFVHPQLPREQFPPFLIANFLLIFSSRCNISSPKINKKKKFDPEYIQFYGSFNISFRLNSILFFCEIFFQSPDKKARNFWICIYKGLWFIHTVKEID